MYIRRYQSILMKSLISLFISFFIWSNVSFTQGTWDWVNKAGGSTSINFYPEYDKGNDIEVNHNNELLVTGFYRGQGVFDTITLSGVGTRNGFLAKYDSVGNVIWAKSIIGTGVLGTSLAFSSNDDIYLIGEFRDSANFGDTTIYSSSYNWQTEIFFAKYATNGDLIWVKRTNPPSIGNNDHEPVEIDIDNFDNIYITGRFQGSASFDTINVTAMGGRDIFLAKLDTSGSVVWVEQIWDNYTNSLVSDMEIDPSGHIYLTGQFQYKIVFNGYTHWGSNNMEVYILKFNPNGMYSWITTGTGPNNNIANAIAVDDNYNIYIAGKFTNTLTFGTLSQTGTGTYEDHFITKFDSAGVSQWHNKITHSYQFEITDITNDPWGNCLLSGFMTDTLNLGADTIISPNLIPRQAFVGSFSPSGISNWGSFGGPSITNHDASANSICTDKCGNPFITGRFNMTSTFGSISVTSSGTDDIFIAKLNPGPATATIYGPTEMCAGDTVELGTQGFINSLWVPGNLTTDTVLVSPNTTQNYLYTSTDTNGCPFSGSHIVTVNSLPILGISNDTSICVGDSAQLYVTGANSYVWTPDSLTDSLILVQPLITQTYWVVGTDTNNCKNVDSTTVLVDSIPLVSITGDTHVCIGDSVVLTANGANTYLWLPDSATSSSIQVAPTVISTYYVIGSAGIGCVNSDSALVMVHKLPLVSITGDTLICPGSTATLYAQGADSYLWLPSSITGDSIQVTPSVGNWYWVTGTDSNQCKNTDSILVEIDTCTSIEEIKQIITSSVYPNPFNSTALISINATNTEDKWVTIYDISGKVVIENIRMSNNQLELRPTQFNRGIYFYTIQYENKLIARGKFIYQ